MIKKKRVRLIGVDTPETVHPTRGEEPFGKEASEYTKSRLEGQTIKLEFDVQERDQYGRLLAYIWIDEEHFNATLVQNGYATVSTWPPNVKYTDLYTELQQEARNSSKGLWGVEAIAAVYRVGNYDIDPATKLPIDKISINTASIEELQLLPGIGETIASRVINSRPYTKEEELLNVSGIGEKTLEKMLEYITVD